MSEKSTVDGKALNLTNQRELTFKVSEQSSSWWKGPETWPIRESKHFLWVNPQLVERPRNLDQSQVGRKVIFLYNTNKKTTFKPSFTCISFSGGKIKITVLSRARKLWWTVRKSAQQTRNKLDLGLSWGSVHCSYFQKLNRLVWPELF